MSHDRSTCLFCQIADGEIPSMRVHEDDDFVAFRDINPLAQTHVLVVPRRHIESLADCEESDAPLLGKMLTLVVRLAKELGVSYTGGDTGFRTVVNTGPGGGQAVYHLHMHLLAGPRPWRRME